MSYYGAKGDFYSGRTGYYRGDPGFFSSLGGIFKGVAGGVLNSFIPGAGALLGGAASAPPPQPTISAAGSAGLGLMGRGGAIGTAVGRSTRARGRLSAIPGMVGRMAGAGAPAAAGIAHVSRLAAAGGMGRMRRGGYRRMNVCNPRALRRAIRRAKGFEKLALRSIRLVSPHRLHGKRRGGFKVSRRRK